MGGGKSILQGVFVFNQVMRRLPVAGWILKNSLWDNNFLYLLPSQTWPLESGSCPGLAIQAEKLGERTGKWVV